MIIKKRLIILSILTMFLFGCNFKEDSDVKNDIDEKIEVLENTSDIEPILEEMEYYAHVFSITELLNEDIDFFYQLNDEAGNRPSVMDTVVWWEDITATLIKFNLSIDLYDDDKHRPSENQKDIHELIIKTHEPLRYVANHFFEAIKEMDLDEVEKCFDNMRKVREYTNQVIELNNRQLDKWKNI